MPGCPRPSPSQDPSIWPELWSVSGAEALHGGGTRSFGYKGDVTFPVDVTPKDPRRPVELVLDLHYATCDQICLPAEAKIDFMLTPEQKLGPEAT